MIAKNASLARSTTLVVEGFGEHDHAGAVGEGADQLGLQRAPVGSRHGRRRVDQHVAAHVGGVRIVGEIGVAQDLGAEVVEVEVGLVDPRRGCGVAGI